MREITDEKIKNYIEKTEMVLKLLKKSVPENSHLNQIAEDFLTMIKSYFSDAIYFFQKGDYVNAFAAINYAYGWIDAGVRIGLIYAGENHDLFTLYK